MLLVAGVHASAEASYTSEVAIRLPLASEPMRTITLPGGGGVADAAGDDSGLSPPAFTAVTTK